MNSASGLIGGQVINVPIEDIIPNRFQPRLNFDDTALKELASSIKEHGIIQPLILRRLGDKYEIIAGERRYKASKMAGLMSVPAIITTMDDKKSAEVAIVENIQRKDLTSIEEAKSYKALLDRGYLTQEELAKKMGLSQSAISNKLRLLTLSETVQNALMEGKISERHARSLLQLHSVEEQEKWLKTIIDERITVKELDGRLKEALNNEKKESENKSDDVPIITLAPNIYDIKENATDIVVPKNEDVDIIIDTPVNDKIPNKFFNYLESESINMNSFDPTTYMNNTNYSLNNDVKSIDASQDEEVEMLDFVAPNNSLENINQPNSLTNSLNTSNETSKKDMTIANDLINTLENNLKNNNYKVNLVKDENDWEIKYTIVISKE